MEFTNDLVRHKFNKKWTSTNAINIQHNLRRLYNKNCRGIDHSHLSNMSFNYVTLRGNRHQDTTAKIRPSTRRFHSDCVAESMKVCGRQITFPVAHSWWDAFISHRDITSVVSHSALTCLLHQFICLFLSFIDSSGTSPHAKTICYNRLSATGSHQNSSL